MGATGWSYFVPYQDNIEKALQDLRQDVFDKGQYHKREVITGIEELKPYFDSMKGFYPEEEIEKTTEQMKRMIRKRASTQQFAPEPKNINQLLDLNAENGTHSIIDIEHISDEVDFGVAAPLSKKKLLRLFGTDKPTREMIETRERTGELDMRERWQGTYIIVYRNEKPDEIFFTGHSGD